MKPIKGYESAQVYKGPAEQLPPGGYVIKILDVKEESTQWGDKLVFSYDIVEGEYTDFYKSNYNSQTQEDKKWKGTYRLSVPADDGSEQDVWKQRRFKTDIVAIEESNNGYHWDWNEKGLVGKIVGALFGRREYEINGRTGFFTECRGFRAAEEIREGHFKIPEEKLLKKDTSPNNMNSMNNIPAGFFQIQEDEGFPFF